MQKHEISPCLTYDFGILPALAIILDMIHLKDFPSRKILAKKKFKIFSTTSRSATKWPKCFENFVFWFWPPYSWKFVFLRPEMDSLTPKLLESTFSLAFYHHHSPFYSWNKVSKGRHTRALFSKQIFVTTVPRENRSTKFDRWRLKIFRKTRRIHCWSLEKIWEYACQNAIFWSEI